jgi:hypothetical protein
MSLRINLALLPIAAALLTVPTANAAKCTDIPLKVTLNETAMLMNLDGTTAGGTVASAIVGDGNDVYTNGQTTGATIKFCSNTYDAVLNLLVGKRKLTAILPAGIAGSGATANTPPPNSYTVNGLFNVNNIICQGCTPGSFGPNQPFVTRVNIGLSSLFNGADYGMQFLPITNISTLPMTPRTGNTPSTPPGANSPNPASLALVIPQSYNCSQGVYPSWVVRGTLQNSTSAPSYLQVGTLFLSPATNGITAGQFSMPFEAQIQALQCFNPGYPGN